ncbi:MAG: AMP-binding protein [Acidobacteria bacterium]|nr:AMP-binding protein [Acidobacteriota bacterium]
MRGARLTYRELDERANHLARHLQQLGVGPDTLVALCFDRSAGWWWRCWRAQGQRRVSAAGPRIPGRAAHLHGIRFRRLASDQHRVAAAQHPGAGSRFDSAGPGSRPIRRRS